MKIQKKIFGRGGGGGGSGRGGGRVGGGQGGTFVKIQKKNGGVGGA